MRTPGTTHGAHHRASLDKVEPLKRIELNPNTPAGQAEARALVDSAIKRGLLKHSAPEVIHQARLSQTERARRRIGL